MGLRMGEVQIWGVYLQSHRGQGGRNNGTKVGIKLKDVSFKKKKKNNIILLYKKKKKKEKKIKWLWVKKKNKV